MSVPDGAEGDGEGEAVEVDDSDGEADAAGVYRGVGS
jgi:hypothetical protein